MKKDINPSPIKDVAVSIAKEVNELNQEVWNVYLINMSSEKISQVEFSDDGKKISLRQTLPSGQNRYLIFDIEKFYFQKSLFLHQY